MGKPRPKDGSRSEGVDSELDLPSAPLHHARTPRKMRCVFSQSAGPGTAGRRLGTMRTRERGWRWMLQQLWANAILQRHVRAWGVGSRTDSEHLLWASPAKPCPLTNPHLTSPCERCCHWYRWGGRGRKRLRL